MINKSVPKENLITAGVLVIGDEILSGRTKDTNSGYIAEYLTAIGIDLKEIRVVSDEANSIVEAINALRQLYTYVFTTGGIGPTHDDITADCVAKAFNVDIDHHPEAVAILKERISAEKLNEARLRMARIPHSAELIKNSVSGAPGFHIGNVFVMAGVPVVMEAMMDVIGTKLDTGRIIHSVTVEANVGEGSVADGLGKIDANFDNVSFGSYPTMREGKYVTNLVARSRDEDQLKVAHKALHDLVDSLL